MNYRPSSSFQAQPWPSSCSTPPLAIPRPRSHSLNPSVNAEWQKLRFDHQQGAGLRSRYTLRGMSRPRTPPSLSPSPSPSASSFCMDYSDDEDDDDLEIEELTEDSDSGIELLVGEYEEAPENYRKELLYDSDEDIAASHKGMLYRLERLSARNRSPSLMVGFKSIMQQKLHREGAFAIPMRKFKRSYAESSWSEASSWGDSGMEEEEAEEEEEGRRIRRRRGIAADDCLSIKTYDEGSNNSSDNEIDMEL